MGFLVFINFSKFPRKYFIKPLDIFINLVYNKHVS